MTALRLKARDLMTEAELVEVRRRSDWQGIALVAHAWAVIGAAMALVAVFPNPVTYLVAVALIGSRQLGLAIPMHDGAHSFATSPARLAFNSARRTRSRSIFSCSRCWRSPGCGGPIRCSGWCRS